MQNSTASLVFRGLRQHASRRQQHVLAAGSRKHICLLQRDGRSRNFHSSRRLDVVKPFVLADIGEGITEVQIIQWFVQPGARVEQFDKLCEVQSDKASVEITSRFDGVIKKLHYEQDDTAKVGKPLCDIDIEGEIDEKDAALLTPEAEQAGTPEDAQQPQKAAEAAQQDRSGTHQQQRQQQEKEERRHTSRFQADPPSERRRPSDDGHVSNLATPAVRGLLRELGVSIEDVRGTGKDGRVLKEDVHNYVADRDAQKNQQSESPQHASTKSTDQGISQPSPPPQPKPRAAAGGDAAPKETVVPLNPIQAQMFKVMTRSLSIPHFMYGDEIDLSALSSLRSKLNSRASSSHDKLSFLPFVIKAVSLALNDYPLLNSRIDIPSSSSSSSASSSPSSSSAVPKLIMRPQHNIGVAIDTPQGLLVPNIKDVGSLSIREISGHLAWLAHQGRRGRLSAQDLTGGTITVSNIGSIGGTYVAPVIVQGEVAILGMGKARAVPAFVEDGGGSGGGRHPDGRDGDGGGRGHGEGSRVVRKTVSHFSWSADHRVVDGATMARMGERVRHLIEQPELMLAELR